MEIYNKSTVTLKDNMGDDLTVVNAARVSFGKESEYEVRSNIDGFFRSELKEADRKLIRFLAKENHILPFAHGQITFHIQAPIFVARQLVKHQVGGVWSEMSYRYIKPIGVYYPDNWREAPENKKQGSVKGSSIDVTSMDHRTWGNRLDVNPVISSFEKSWETYEYLIDKGVCAEQARSVLPLATMTEWTWTGSLLFWARVANLRLKDDTQEETRDVAKQISHKVEQLFPVCWEELVLNHGAKR